MGTYSYAWDRPVLLCSIFSQKDINKIKISDISNAFEVKDKVDELLYDDAKQFIAMGDVVTAIENTNGTSFEINTAGTKLVYIEADDDEYGKLFKADITSSGIKKAEAYDTDVYTNLPYSNKVCDKLVYFKDVKANGGIIGDLYVNKELICKDAYFNSIRYKEKTDSIVSFSDWSIERGLGTLNVYGNNKGVVIAEDVALFDFTANGEILYLNNSGNLYLYKDGAEDKLIDEDVSDILTIYGE